MENNHGLGVTPRSCHAKSFMDLAEYPGKLNTVANVAIPKRRRWQTPAGNLSSAVNRPSSFEWNKTALPPELHERVMVRAEQPWSCAKSYSKGEHGAVSPLLGCCSHPKSPQGRWVLLFTVYERATFITKKNPQTRLFLDLIVQMGAHICLSFSDDNHIYTSWLKCFNKWLPDENTFSWLRRWGLLIFAMIRITIQIEKAEQNQ